jgi:hypothetical protein
VILYYYGNLINIAGSPIPQENCFSIEKAEWYKIRDSDPEELIAILKALQVFTEAQIL